MVYVLISENFNMALFLKVFFYDLYISDFHKKMILDLEVTVFKRVKKFLWYSYLNERKNAKKFRKIAITCRDKQAAVKSITLTLDYYSNFAWPDATRNNPGQVHSFNLRRR